MTDNIYFSKDRFFLFRRIITLASFLLSCLCVALLSFGFVSFRGRSISVLGAVNNALEIMNLGKRPFWLCVSCTFFSVIYGIVVVKGVIDIIACIKSTIKAVKSEEDTGDIRSMTRYVVEKSTVNVWRFLLIFTLSYALSDFFIGVGTLLVTILLIVLSVLLNCAQNMLYKGKIYDSVISSVYIGIMFAAMVMFALMSPNIQVVDTIKSAGQLFNVMSMKGIPGKDILLMFVQSVLIPLIYILNLVSIIRLYPKITDPGADVKEITKKTLKRNIVFLCIVLVLTGFANGYTDIMDYVGIVFDHMMFVAMTAMLFIASRNLESTENDKFQII